MRLRHSGARAIFFAFSYLVPTISAMWKWLAISPRRADGSL
uniref:Uncharacterized protein n=1 Tax=Setaria italica TaxID=4555 RepID=K3XR58_SETIT